MKQLRIFSGFVLAVIMATMLGCASSPSSSESASEVSADSAITSKVKSAFQGDRYLKTCNILVKTTDSVVQLDGEVTSRIGKRKAGKVASKVEGVKSVKNNLRVVKRSPIKKKSVKQEEQKKE